MRKKLSMSIIEIVCLKTLLWVFTSIALLTWLVGAVICWGFGATETLFAILLSKPLRALPFGSFPCFPADGLTWVPFRILARQSLPWLFFLLGFLGICAGVATAYGVYRIKLWRTRPRYKNMYAKLLNQPRRAQQEGVQYPPLPSGIAVKSLEEILEPKIELIKLISQTTETANVFDDKYWPAIGRYAQSVHLLPASAGDHHFAPGGLLHHGLEVGFYSMQWGRATLYGQKLGVKKRSARERWLYACFLAGLCHDLGKVATDMRVTSGVDGLVWSPHLEGLMDWAEKNKLKKYYVDWQPDRHKVHESFTQQMLGKVLTDEDRYFLNEIDSGLLREMMLALGPVAEPAGEAPPLVSPSNIRDIVQQADFQSVEADQKKSRSPADLGIQTLTPMVRHYHDAIQRLFREGQWRINEPGGVVWVMGPHQDLYLVSPRCEMELYNVLVTDGVEGSPAAPEVIAEILGKNDLVLTAPDGGYYWQIKPGNLNGDPLTTLRVNSIWAAHLAGLLPPGLSGLVESGDGTSSSWQPVEGDAGLKAGLDNRDFKPRVLKDGSGNPGPQGWKEVRAGDEQSAGKVDWRTLIIAAVCLCLGYLISMGHILYLGKEMYPEYPWPFFVYGALNNVLVDGDYLRLAALCLLFFWGLGVFPLVRRIYKKAQREAEEIKNEAETFRDGAKQEAVDIVADARREAGEIKKIASDEAAEIRITAQQKAAEVSQNADREAQGKIAQAREKMNELWSWVEAKAKDVGVTPDELQEALQARKKAQEEGAAIIAQAQVQAREEASKIIAEARTQAQRESKEELSRARAEAVEIVGQALTSRRGQEQEAQAQADRQLQDNQRDLGLEEPKENDPALGEGMDQEAHQVQVLADKIWQILSNQPEMTKRELERRGAKSYYGHIWELALANLLTAGRIAYDLEYKTYKCQNQ